MLQALPCHRYGRLPENCVPLWRSFCNKLFVTFFWGTQGRLHVLEAPICSLATLASLKAEDTCFQTWVPRKQNPSCSKTFMSGSPNIEGPWQGFSSKDDLILGPLLHVSRARNSETLNRVAWGFGWQGLHP